MLSGTTIHQRETRSCTTRRRKRNVRWALRMKKHVDNYQYPLTDALKILTKMMVKGILSQ